MQYFYEDAYDDTIRGIVNLFVETEYVVELE